MGKVDSKLSDKVDQLQMRINSLKVSKCALEKNHLSSIHREQVAENQIEALIRLAEFLPLEGSRKCSPRGGALLC